MLGFGLVLLCLGLILFIAGAKGLFNRGDVDPSSALLTNISGFVITICGSILTIISLVQGIPDLPDNLDNYTLYDFVYATPTDDENDWVVLIKTLNGEFRLYWWDGQPPLGIAYQDGDGTWQPFTPDAPPPPAPLNER